MVQLNHNILFHLTFTLQTLKCIIDRRESARPPFALLPPRKNFIQAKFDFIEEMLRFGRTHPEQLAEQTSDPTTDVEELDSSLNATSHSTPEKFRILDVGCGIGGTSRYAAV